MVVDEVARDSIFEVLWEIAKGVVVSLLRDGLAKRCAATTRGLGTVFRIRDADLEAMDKAQQQNALRHDGRFFKDTRSKGFNQSVGRYQGIADSWIMWWEGLG